MAISSIVVSLRILNGSIPLLPNSVVDGSLDFEGFGSVVSLPENLTVEGNLHLRGTSICSLPKGLRVFGSVELEGCKSLREICENVEIGRDLDLEGCSHITSLPKSLVVCRDLYLFGTKVHEIPADVIVRGQTFDLQ